MESRKNSMSNDTRPELPRDDVPFTCFNSFHSEHPKICERWCGYDWCKALADRAARQDAPPGWQLVPVKPTPEMIEASCRADGSDYWRSERAAIYSAMVSAAPNAPSAQPAPAIEPVALPRTDSTVAAIMIETVLEEYGWPANKMNAARAGYEAAFRWLRSTAPTQAAPSAPEAPQPSARQERLRKAMERFDRLGPLPGMIQAFETHVGASWTDPEWKQEAALWAGAWAACKQAALHLGNLDDPTKDGANASRSDGPNPVIGTFDNVEKLIDELRSGRADEAAEPDLWKHVKTGRTYRVLMRARMEVDQTDVVVYRQESDADVYTWVRPASEFNDGRFERAARTPKP
jgi:hypothetical protein